MRNLIARDSTQRCTLILIADGFEETETILLLSALRQAGLCVKCVGLTSGLVSSAHGIWLKPDLGFADLDQVLDTTAISAVILPTGRQSLAKLEADPRVHKLLWRVVGGGGQIVTDPEGLPTLRAAAVRGNEPGEINGAPDEPVICRNPIESLESFAQALIRRLLPPSP